MSEKLTDPNPEKSQTKIQYQSTSLLKTIIHISDQARLSPNPTELSQSFENPGVQYRLT